MGGSIRCIISLLLLYPCGLIGLKQFESLGRIVNPQLSFDAVKRILGSQLVQSHTISPDTLFPSCSKSSVHQMNDEFIHRTESFFFLVIQIS